MKAKRAYFGLALAAALGVTAPDVSAQIKQVTNNSDVLVNLSQKDPSRFSVTGDRIQSLVIEQGRFTVTTDEVIGDAFVKLASLDAQCWSTEKPAVDQAKPVAQGKPEDNAQPQRRPIICPATFYVKTEKGFTYKVIASFHDIPGAQVTLVNPEVSVTTESDDWERKTPYQETIIRLMQAMANDRPIQTYESSFAEVKVSSGSLDVTSVARHRGRAFEGETFLTRNAGQKHVVLKETQFSSGKVAAVFIEQPMLAPGQQTRVHVVMRRGKGGNNGN